MSRMTGPQIAELMVDKLIGVINDQRKKDIKTNRSRSESDASILSALTLLTAQLVVNIAPAEHIEETLVFLDEHVRDEVENIIQSNSN